MTKTGRPSKFGTIDMAQVEKLAKRGWTDEDMAAFFGIGITTWDRWKVAHPKFRGALKDWKIEADARVVRKLYERAMGYSAPDTKFATHEGKISDEREYIKHYPPDTTAAIFWLKNRDKENWRDRTDHEHSGRDGGPIETIKRVIVDSAKNPDK